MAKITLVNCKFARETLIHWGRAPRKEAGRGAAPHDRKVKLASKIKPIKSRRCTEEGF